MAKARPTKEEMDCLGHFNMELFYISEIIESFCLYAPQIDQSSVKCLTKIVHNISSCLNKDKIRKVYDSDAKIVPENFESVILSRSLVCKNCNEVIPFLWKLLRQHKCPGMDQTSGGKDQISMECTSDQKSPALDKENIIEQSSMEVLSKVIVREDNNDLKPEIHSQILISTDTKDLLSDPMKAIQEIKRNFDILKNSRSNLIQIIVNQLEDLLQTEFREIKVYPFGSCLTGLGSNTSTLDLFVDVYNYFYEPLSDKGVLTEIMMLVKKHLSYLGSSSWNNLNPVHHTENPILKVRNMIYGIPCNLSFNSGLPIVSTEFISYLFDLQPDCKNVSCFVKIWCQSIFNENPDCQISSYLISLLVIFYMQTIKLLPSVWNLQKKIKNPTMIGNWRGEFKKLNLLQLGIRKSNDPLQILIDFFEFYNLFDYEKFVVCPFLGRPVLRNVFDYPEKLPNEMIDYKNYVRKLSLTTKNSMKLLKMDTEMCVQDPFELCFNVSKDIEEPVFEQFKQLCAESVKELRQSSTNKN